MAVRTKSSILPILILAVAIALWAFDAYRQGDFGKAREREGRQEQDAVGNPPKVNPKHSGKEPPRTGNYDTYSGCTLVADKGNDGDSFRVKLTDGRTEIIRLYFADCPESAFKNYGSGQNNHARIQEQAADLGGITPQQAVEIGKKAKNLTLATLESAPFTIYTEWDSPFNDKRFHGYIVVSYNGKPRFLHELLVEKGLARIHTKGAPLPNGTSERKQEDRLLDLQRTAKSKDIGAWGL